LLPSLLILKGVKLAGHCFYDCCRNVLTISLQSSSSTACNTSFGVQTFLVGSLVGRMTGSLLDRGVFDSLALITEEPLVGIDIRSLMV